MLHLFEIHQIEINIKYLSFLKKERYREEIEIDGVNIFINNDFPYFIV